MSDLISLPLKRASDVDLAKPLKHLIQSLYSSSDSPADFSHAIAELGKLRGQAVSKGLDRSLPALEVLYRYHDQLAALETKIPAHEVQIPFKWKDAFDKGSLFGGRVSATSTSLSFEKTCVLFNIAALQSQIGAAGRDSSDEELKTAAKLFQLSSSILTHLSRTAAATLAGQEPTPDLQPETLQALAALMLAQAQEIFVSKSVQDKMKEGVIARLCAQSEEMYAEALKLMQKESVKHLWEREWVGIVAGKQSAYSALTHYFQSVVAGQRKQAGEQIARLQLCLELLKQSQQRSGIPTFFSDYVAKATTQLTGAKRDNDFIYHERVPEPASLAPVERSARLAKQSPVEGRMGSGKDLFEDLIPLSVHQAMAACELRRSELVGKTVGRLREATQTLNAVLASLNLPAAVEDSAGDEIPESLREKARVVQEGGGVAELERAVNEIPELVQRNKEILDEADRLLTEEEQSDQQLRAQLKERWTRTPSERLNGTLKTNSARYREIINNALSADDVVKQKFTTHRPAMEMLSSGNLAACIPKPAEGEEQGSASVKAELRELMGEVTALKTARSALESEIKSLSFDLKTPFLTALAQDGAIDEQLVSIQTLGSNYGPLEQRTNQSLTEQENLLIVVQRKCEQMGRGGASAHRDQVMRQVAEGYDAYVDLQSNIREGTKFYNDLTQLLLAFQNKINDYCFARKTEKEELLKDVTRDASTAPPARPPAPAASAPQFPAAPGAVPYPPQAHYNTMPMPNYYTPMPSGYNPYATYAPGAGYGAPAGGQQQGYPTPGPPYPVQPMGYPPFYPPGQQPPPQ